MYRTKLKFRVNTEIVSIIILTVEGLEGLDLGADANAPVFKRENRPR